MSKRKRHRTSSPLPAKAASQPAAATATAPSATKPPARAGRVVRIGCLLAGLVLPQLLLLGSSLWGGSVLLPLDILAGETVYLPRESPGDEWPQPKDGLLADLVLQAEPYRRLVTEEVRAGRLPLWDPYSYAGHPLLAANQPQVFSPYMLMSYLWPSPTVLAWQALLRALVIGTGSYLFFRRAMQIGGGAAVLVACAVPHFGTMITSGGYPGAAVLSFLPWVLLAADGVARRPRPLVVAGLAIATACTLLSGHSAFAGQVLLVGGVYYLTRLIARVGLRQLLGRAALTSIGAAAGGVVLGFLLSAPQTLPTVDYLRSSQRIAQRQAVGEETAPSGPSAVLQMVLPYAYGSTQLGSHYTGGAGNRIESAAGGYAGLLFALVLAPLGWADRSRRWWMVFWSAVVILAITPTVGIPVLSLLFEVPPVSLLRNNRLVFAAAVAILAMAAIGVNALISDPSSIRRPAALIAASVGGLLTLLLAGWCLRGVDITPVGQDTAAIPADVNLLAILWPDAWASATGGDIISWFGLMYRNGLLLCVLALIAIVTLQVAARQRSARQDDDNPSAQRPPLVGPTAVAGLAVGLLAIAEMLTMSFGVNVRGDPSRYYPRLAWMDAIADKPGRICGADYFPANLSLFHRQRDIRGYDAADPLPTVELILLARPPAEQIWYPWAVTQYMTVDPASPQPVANLLGVRHIVGQGPPPPGATPWWTGDGVWLVENPRALPRVTLPREMRVVPLAADRLAQLGSPGHDPAAVTLLEAPPPASGGVAEGTAAIVQDLPNRVAIEVDLSRGGIVRLADAWDAGWRATYNGEPVELLRVDHALRGVVAPAGRGTIVFEYAPASFRWGLILAAVAAVIVVGMALKSVVSRQQKRREGHPADVY